MSTGDPPIDGLPIDVGYPNYVGDMPSLATGDPMSIITTLEKGASYAVYALTALMEIQKITGTGGVVAEEALAAVDGILKDFAAKLGADVTPASILADMAAADKSVLADDAAADASLAAKFPPEASGK